MIFEKMELNRKKTMNKKMRSSLLWCLPLLSLLLLVCDVHAQTRSFTFKNGAVMARSLALDENNQPILVEYNEQGEEVKKIDIQNEDALQVAKLKVITAFEYRQEKARLDKFEEIHKDDLWEDAEVMALDKFKETEFTTADGKTKIEVPTLPSYVKSVLVRGRSARINTDPSELVLLSFSVDLSEEKTVPEKGSLIINDKGQVIYTSTNNIAPRVGFFGDPNEKQEFYGGVRKPEDKIYGPVKYVKVYISPEAFPGSMTSSDHQGKYNMAFMLPYCPGGFEYSTDLWAEIHYANFSPHGAPSIPYYLRRQDWTFCYDLPPYAGGTLMGAMAYVNAMAILAGTAIPMYNIDFKVDVMFLSGRILLRNPDGSPVTIGNVTEYEVTAPDNKRIVQENYDFDGDGKLDRVVLGRMVDKPQEDGSTKKVFEAYPAEQAGNVTDENALQGVYLSGSENSANEEPDFVRLADTKKNVTASGSLNYINNGKLKSISKDDLKNTDIYVFRESTGQLVLERNGLKDEEVASRVDIGLGKDDKFYYYRLMLRGPMDTAINVGAIDRSQNWEDWAERYRLAEPFRKRESDYLKSGEWVRLVVINRVTGYTGTQRIQLGDASKSPRSMLSVKLDDTYLQPPNLKIWAERKYTVEKGIINNEDKEKHYLIGQEGAALTSDDLVEVFTEWLDEEGRPLPEGLGADEGQQYGLSGRLARTTGKNTLAPAGSGDLANFAIPPGRNIQVLKISDNQATPENFYVHVVGTQQDEKPNFSGNNKAEGLAGRPDKFTPFLTPLYDENKNWKTWNAYQKLKQEWAEEENPDEENKPEKPLPFYVWGYRPEYQFSQYELEIAELNRVTTDENGTEEKTDIYDAKTPVIASSDKLIELLYSLVGPNSERLDAIDGPQDLVFALGEEEIKVEIGSDKQIRFENLAHLASLMPEDYLTLRLYSNQDAGNILFEYAFEYLQIDTTNIDAENWTGQCMNISADEPEVQLYTSLVGYGSRDEDKKADYLVQWSVEGGGSLSDTNTPVDENGFTFSKLTMPRIEGSQAKVLASIQGSDDTKAIFQYVCVEPGAPANIQIQNDGIPIYFGAINKRKYTVRVTDKWGNYVKDGTQVDLDVIGDLDVVASQYETRNGMATIEVTATENFGSRNALAVSVGNYVYQEANVEVMPTEVRMVIHEELSANNTVPFTVTTTPAQAGTDVTLYTDVGTFSSSMITTDASGVASGTLKTSPYGKKGSITATIGISARDKKPLEIIGDSVVSVSTPVMIGDVVGDGSMTIKDDLGFSYSAAYLATMDVDLHGAPGETLNVNLGSKAHPVARQQVSFPMNLIFDGHTMDAANGLKARVFNVSTHLDGVKKAFNFGGFEDQESYMSLPAETALTLAPEWRASVNIKPAVQSGEVELIKIRDGVKLVRQSNNKLRLEIISADETQILVTDNALPENQWSTVSIAIQGGNAELSVINGETKILPGVKIPKATTTETALEIGRGYKGLMSDFGLTYSGSAAAPVATFADDTLTKTVTIGASGKTTVKLKSTGRLSSNSSYQQVDLDVNGKAYPIYLISRNQHKQLVIKSTLSNAAYMDAVIASPDISINSNPLMDVLAPPAYALSFSFTASDFLDLYRSTQELTLNITGALGDADFWKGMGDGLKQLGKEELEGMKDNARQLWEELANGEMDEVQVAILTLRVALMIPVARRYLARTGEPLIKFLKRYGNKPAGKYMAQALLKVLLPIIKKGDVDPLIASLYGMIFIADMTELILSGEGTEYVAIVDELMDSVDSADDFIGMFSFAQLSVKYLNPSCTSDLNVINYVETSMVEPFVVDAYAASGALKLAKRISIRPFLKQFKNALGKVDKSEDPLKPVDPKKKFSLAKVIRSIGDALLAAETLPAGESIKEEVKALLEKIIDERVLLVSMVLTHREGPGALKALLSGKMPLRAGLVDLVASIAKIEEAASKGLLDKQNYELDLIGQSASTDDRLVKWKIREKYKNVFIDVIPQPAPKASERPTSYVAVNKMNGDAFHLIVIASLLSRNETILGVEAQANIQIKKSVNGKAKDVGKALNRRVDVVTGSGTNNVKWHEIKSLAYNTSKKGGTEKKAAYKKALGSLDLPTITNITQSSNEDELALMAEEDLVIKSNQFYSKEFFVDRVFAGSDTANVKNRIRWVFQDFEKKINEFDDRSGGKKGDIVVSKEEFLQCGINKEKCTKYSSTQPLPLDDIRDKLAGGIRNDNRKDVLGILRHTFPNAQLEDDDSVKSYLKKFIPLKKEIIISENSSDWLITSANENITGMCKANDN